MSGHAKWEPGRRGALIRHLHKHPDHERRWPAGHDFVLVSTSEIEFMHEQLHTGLLSNVVVHRHSPGSQLRVQGEKEEMPKSLDLKVTVVGSTADPDAILAKANPETIIRLHTNPFTSLKIEKIERADGLPFGLESAFEDYWREANLEGDDEENEEKRVARHAFLAAAQKFGKGK